MFARTLAFALVALSAAACFAQPPVAASGPKRPSATPKFAVPADDALYRALGGQAGLVALMDDFVPRLAADPRIGHFFAKTDLPYFKDMLVQQFCVVSGGGCRYQGMGMKDAHDEFDVRMADFNTLVELLQVSMDARGIPFATQNRLLAVLAPMHREVVNTH